MVFGDREQSAVKGLNLLEVGVGSEQGCSLRSSFILFHTSKEVSRLTYALDAQNGIHIAFIAKSSCIQCNKVLAMEAIVIIGIKMSNETFGSLGSFNRDASSIQQRINSVSFKRRPSRS